MNFSDFSQAQRKYIVFKQQHPELSIVDACAELGFKESMVYNWPKEVKEFIISEDSRTRDAALGLIRSQQNEQIATLQYISINGDFKERTRAAQLLLEWGIGKPISPIELTGKDGAEFKGPAVWLPAVEELEESD